MYYKPDAKKLKAACDSVVDSEDYVANGGITYCNMAVRDILGALGLDLFWLEKKNRCMLANEMIDYMDKCGGKFAPVKDGTDAAAMAKQGYVQIACEKGSAHGHVAVVYPGEMEMSPSWGKFVPMLANVGKKNGIMRASKCFQEEPRYFVVIPF